MSAHRGGRRRGRRGGGHAGGHENEERWLLTYSDMITLLMALFMVLFSISSVNISKYKSLQQSLQDAFSGRVLKGGKSVLESGSDGKSPGHQAAPPIAPIKPQVGQTAIVRRGLVVRLLTDNVVFDPGQAVLKPPAIPVLSGVAHALNIDKTHPIMVEGHTDNVPISGSQFPSNWELSTARASVVVRFFIRAGLDKYRLGAAGYANLYPVGSNSTASGRSKNRRVEIVLLRQDQSITPDMPRTG
jgi:chemotaxis protein MotB